MSPPDRVLVAGASSDLGIALIRRLLESGDASILAHYHKSPERIERLGAQGRIRAHPAGLQKRETAGQAGDAG